MAAASSQGKSSCDVFLTCLLAYLLDLSQD